jgi:hypothetical protein
MEGGIPLSKERSLIEDDIDHNRSRDVKDATAVHTGLSNLLDTRWIVV